MASIAVSSGPDIISSSATTAPDSATLDESSATIPARAEQEDMFALFLQLPIEIQDIIWNFGAQKAANLPRVHILKAPQEIDRQATGFVRKHSSTCAQLGSDIANHYHCKNTTSTPALLRACRGARQTALKYFKAKFEENLMYPIYFNPALDTLLFVDELCFRNFINYSNGAPLDSIWKITVAIMQPFYGEDWVHGGDARFNACEIVGHAKFYLPDIYSITVLKASIGAYTHDTHPAIHRTPIKYSLVLLWTPKCTIAARRI